MNIFIVMDVLAVIYIIVGIALGVMAYVAPVSELFEEHVEEWAGMINTTPSTLNVLASIVIAIIWPYVVYNAFSNKKARK